MPSLVAVLFDPPKDRPEPKQINTFRVIGFGTLAWLAAGIATTVMYLSEKVSYHIPLATLVGIALGGIWWVYEKARLSAQQPTTRAMRRSGESSPPEH